MSEWYIDAYERTEYLHNKKLIFKKYEDNDHDHCEICWDRFSSYPEDQHSGYYEHESKSWICESCYNDFKDLFKWEVE